MLNEKSEKRPWRADKEALVSFYTEFCCGTKVFVRNAHVEGLFAECTMSNHNDRFDMLTYFIQSWVGGVVFLVSQGQTTLSQFENKYARWR